MAEQRTFTETEHFALLTDAVARETSELASAKQELEATVETVTAEKAQEIASLQARIDVLDAEKLAAQKAADDTVAEFEAFKNDLAQKAATEARKADRVSKVKEVADDLSDEYFSEARVQRWAEMSDETFDALVADLVEMASKRKPKTEASTEAAADETEAARETAAFTGGVTPTSETGSVLGKFLRSTGRTAGAV